MAARRWASSSGSCRSSPGKRRWPRSTSSSDLLLRLACIQVQEQVSFLFMVFFCSWCLVVSCMKNLAASMKWVLFYFAIHNLKFKLTHNILTLFLLFLSSNLDRTHVSVFTFLVSNQRFASTTSLIAFGDDLLLLFWCWFIASFFNFFHWYSNLIFDFLLAQPVPTQLSHPFKPPTCPPPYLKVIQTKMGHK